MTRKLFECTEVPIQQNRVYASAATARNAPTGTLEIVLDDDFAWNDTFDPELMKYDEEYDNAVPSARFDAYYDEIGDYLARTHELDRGPVVDVGCGKGTFLKRMAQRHDIRGVGIDPAYEGPSEIGKLRFIAEKFHRGLLDRAASLILCRHTLEHIPEPATFLGSILDEIVGETETPVFCEVPDLGWILEQQSWWDFCYEHVNYFSAPSFERCLQQAGCNAATATPAFGDQYLWGEGTANARRVLHNRETDRDSLLAGADLNLAVEAAIERIRDAAAGRPIVIWGMATKGVMYALHAERHGLTVAFGVDINQHKQGMFAPVTGLPIVSPDDLPLDEEYAVVCVNPNYSAEIRDHLERLGVKFALLDP